MVSITLRYGKRAERLVSIRAGKLHASLKMLEEGIIIDDGVEMPFELGEEVTYSFPAGTPLTTESLSTVERNINRPFTVTVKAGHATLTK
jgi:hypothetical protein